MKTVGIFLSFFLRISSAFSSTVIKTDLGKCITPLKKISMLIETHQKASQILKIIIIFVSLYISGYAEQLIASNQQADSLSSMAS